MKCIVKDCVNQANEGRFIGDLCSPCHEFVTTGSGIYSQVYRNTQREWVGLTDAEIYSEGGKHEKFAKNGNEWFDRGSFARAIEAKLKQKNGYAEEKNT